MSSLITNGARPAPLVRLAVLAGATVTMATVFFVSRSDVLAEPGLNAALRGLNIVSAVGVGAVTWSLRPHSRLGPVLVVIGFLYAATSLQASPDPVVYNLGRLLLPLSTLAMFYASLAFPTGHIERPGERRLMVAVATAMIVAWTAEALTSQHLQVSSVLTDCDGACPANPFDVVDASGTMIAAYAAQAAGAWAVAVALLVRLRAASLAQRLTLDAVVVLVALLAAAFSAATFLHIAGEQDLVIAVGSVYAPLYVAIPLTFLLGQIRGRLFAAGALRRVLANLGPHPSAMHVERDMARALDDPSLRVAYPAPAGGGFLDTSGRPVAVPANGGGVVELRDEVGLVAAIIHDPALDDVAGLMDAAGAAALLALRNAQLSTVLKASVLDLHASRGRIASAGHDARRRLQREVATGPERQLAAVRSELDAAARDVGDADARELLSALALETRETLASVRATARGIYPTLLAEGGIAKALQAELAGSPWVEVREAAGTARRPQDQAAAVFFSCLEAVQNALKHAGDGTRITVSLGPADTGLGFTVVDDGRGFDLTGEQGGAGLTNIRDRIEAVGGTVRITSLPGRGTTVAGTVG